MLATDAGYFWSTSTSSIAANAPIPINSGSSIVGSGISLTGTDTIVLAEPGVYLVSYFLQADAQAGNETVRAMLTLNGTQVPGTHITSVTATGTADPIEPALSNTVIVTVTAPNSQLRLVNGALAVGHVETVAGATTAAVNVVQLS